MGNLVVLNFLFSILLYAVIIVFGVWFALTLIKTNRERNEMLKIISKQLTSLELNGKEE